jgi:sugar phosphate isomerase/epimerase
MHRSVSFGARAHSLEEIEESARLGFDVAEIDWKDAETIYRERDILLELRKTLSLTYLAHGPNEKDRSDADEISEHMAPKICRLLDLASEMGIQTYTQHLCLDARSLSQEVIRRKTEVLKLWSEHAAKRGVTFCIENLSEHAHHFEKAFQSIPELSMTLDVGHGELLTEKNTSIGFIERFSERIHHVHLHDNNGGSSSKSDLHLPIGWGSIDIFSIIEGLVSSGYSGILCFEVPVEHMPESRDRIRRMMSTLERRGG